MKLFGYDIAKSYRDPFEERSAQAEVETTLEPNEIQKAVEQWDWTRQTLVSGLNTAPPMHDPFLLAALSESNGYHSDAIYVKQAITVGQGFQCSDRLMEIIQHPNEEDSFQDLLDKTQLDLETYGSMYVEVATTDFKNWALYQSPALATRVRPNLAGGDHSFIQFAYGLLNGYHNLQANEFFNYKYGMRSGIRQLKLPSVTGDRWYGHPEYISAKMPLSLNFNIASLASKWFENSMILDKLFVMEGAKLTKQQKADLTGFMRKSLKGVRNSAKSLVLELSRGSKLDVKDMNAAVKESSFGGLRNENRDEIAAAHRVPPRLLGIIPAGQLGSTGEVEGQLLIFKILFADHRQRKVQAFWQRLFKDMNLPDWHTFELKSPDINGGALDGKQLAALTAAGAFTPQQANQLATDEWFTEKGELSPQGATQFMRVLKMIRKGADLL